MKLRVIKEHISTYPNPISFKAGDIVVTGVRDDEFEGWIRVTTGCGNEGGAPEQYIDMTKLPVTAKQDYLATELNTQNGEVLEGITFLNEWVWVRNSELQLGWIPCNTTTKF